MRLLMAPAQYHDHAWMAVACSPAARLGAILLPLEILHRALVLFRRGARFEGAEVAALAGLRTDLSGIEPVFARLQFADHDTPPPSRRASRINRDCRALVPGSSPGIRAGHGGDAAPHVTPT